MKVFQKVNIVRCLALVLAVLCLVLVNGERVEAAEIPTVRISGSFKSDGISIPYYYTDVVNCTDSKYNNQDIFLKMSHPVYICMGKTSSGNIKMYFISDSKPTGEWIIKDGTTFQYTAWYQENINGKTYYYYDYTFKNKTHDLDYVLINDYATMVSDFITYYFSNDFDDLIPDVRPELDFNSALDASWVWIEDFRASLKDDTIYMTWGEFKSTLIQAVDELKQYEYRYIGLAAYFRDERYETDKSYDDYYITDVIYTDYTDYEGSITFEDFEAPEGYRLLYLYAYPFWFWDDDPEGNLQKGKASLITFDENGNSNNALIKDPNDIYNPIDPDFSNWNAITNFTGNYFQNMQQTFNNTFQNYDASGMDDNTGNLEDGLKNYSNAQDVILDDVAANIAQYNPADYLNFTDSVMVAMGLVSGWINMFLNVSGEFTVVFIVGCVMVVFFVVLGIWRFQ